MAVQLRRLEHTTK